MSRQVLRKRSFSSASPSPSPPPVSKSSYVSLSIELPSPDPTPSTKRVKYCSTEMEEDDDNNKENIPPKSPYPQDSGALDSAHSSNTGTTTSTSPMTSRALRAARRASGASVNPLPRHRRVSSSRSQSTSRPSSPPPTPHASERTTVPPTPSRSVSRFSMATPPSTPAHTSLQDPYKPKTDSLHAVSHTLLRPQFDNSAPLVGREDERKQIMDFLRPFFVGRHSQDATSLYISGAPGTGKTALVNEVLASISSERTDIDGDSALLHTSYLNCMTLGAKDGMARVYDRLFEHLRKEKTKKREVITAKMDWSERFGNLLRGLKCVLVLDEIDHLVAQMPSTTLTQILALAANRHTRSCLRIIGISNTHTLTHAPGVHTRTIHFQPYSSAQMKSILGKRLDILSTSGFDATKVFPASTVALLAFKISNKTGDIRTVFSVARRALDLAAAGTQDSSIVVTPTHVLSALKISRVSSQTVKDGSETVTRVRNLGLQSRFALAALLLATKRVTAGLSISVTSSRILKENALPHSPSKSQARDTNAMTIEMTALHCFYATILSRNGGFNGVGRTEFCDLVGLLETSGLVELDHGAFRNKMKSPTKGKGTRSVSVARGVREEEVVRGLLGSTSSLAKEVDVTVEEVKTVWEKESRRLERETKEIFGHAAEMKDYFHGAENTADNV